jgi:hypothetical protein
MHREEKNLQRLPEVRTLSRITSMCCTNRPVLRSETTPSTDMISRKHTSHANPASDPSLEDTQSSTTRSGPLPLTTAFKQRPKSSLALLRHGTDTQG